MWIFLSPVWVQFSGLFGRSPKLLKVLEFLVRLEAHSGRGNSLWMEAQRDAFTDFFFKISQWEFPGDGKRSPAPTEVSFYGLRRREFTRKRSRTVKDLSTCCRGGGRGETGDLHIPVSWCQVFVGDTVGGGGLSCFHAGITHESSPPRLSNKPPTPSRKFRFKTRETQTSFCLTEKLL